MNRLAYLLAIFLLSGLAFADINYEIRKGDTLWGISKRFYKNPFKWSVIWKYNTYISNPDLIYPKKFVAIPLKSKAEKKNTAYAEIDLSKFERLTDAVGEFTLENAIALKEDPDTLNILGVTKQTSTDIKDDEKFEHIKRVLGFYKDGQYELVFESPINSEVVSIQDGKFNAADGDIVYVVSEKSFLVGDKVVFLEPLKSEDKFVVYSYAGEGVVYKKSGNSYQIRATKVYDAIRSGLKVVDYIKNDFPMPVEFLKTDLDKKGVIIGMQHNSSMSGQGYTAVLNIGKNSGIKPGDIFSIYRYVVEGGFKNRIVVGEGVVVYAQDRYATLAILSNNQEIMEGDMVSLDMVAVQ
ncbi:LysM peptidoglycan-binding domain-containing protein [Calditerrivibrio nitroreducens]|uniref:LysM peptidoglycan-binding domain-containing protein n=1 Tax=Calditerrivibrio nitroreducens TaxID=477976 RepID=UPI003C76A996